MQKFKIRLPCWSLMTKASAIQNEKEKKSKAVPKSKKKGLFWKIDDEKEKAAPKTTNPFIDDPFYHSLQWVVETEGSSQACKVVITVKIRSRFLQATGVATLQILNTKLITEKEWKAEHSHVFKQDSCASWHFEFKEGWKEPLEIEIAHLSAPQFTAVVS